MTDLDHILPLWRELRQTGTGYVLATVVEVEGSGYRKPGARMMIAADGRRAGTVSGGCLEAEVAKKAFWLTERGPAVLPYSTHPDDGDVPFGMGCGGVIHVLLERSETAEPMLQRLASHYAARTPLAVATALDGACAGTHGYWPEDAASSTETALTELARRSYENCAGSSRSATLEDGERAAVHIGWNPARMGLFVFGAGDDAMPLARMARQLGWYVTVADGRVNLATRARFPEAHEVFVLPSGRFPALDLRPGDACAAMTHSLEQDSRVLAAMLDLDLAYIGVLGPRRRTEEIVRSLLNRMGLPTSRIGEEAELRMSRLHAPMGLELGGDTPAEIAVAAIAEIQRVRHGTTGRPLRELRSRDAIAEDKAHNQTVPR